VAMPIRHDSPRQSGSDRRRARPRFAARTLAELRSPRRVEWARGACEGILADAQCERRSIRCARDGALLGS
jgi:hypothetical protein